MKLYKLCLLFFPIFSGNFIINAGLKDLLCCCGQKEAPSNRSVPNSPSSEALKKFTEENSNHWSTDIDVIKLSKQVDNKKNLSDSKKLRAIAIKFDVNRFSPEYNKDEYQEFLNDIRKATFNRRNSSIKKLKNALDPEKINRIEEQSGLGMILVYFANSIGMAEAKKLFNINGATEIVDLKTLAQKEDLTKLSFNFNVLNEQKQIKERYSEILHFSSDEE